MTEPRFNPETKAYEIEHPTIDGYMIERDSYSACVAAYGDALRVAGKHRQHNANALHDIAATEMRGYGCDCKLPGQSCPDCREAARDAAGDDIPVPGVDFDYHERTHRLEELAMTADLEDRFGPVVEG
jgi:hypothetical protein